MNKSTGIVDSNSTKYFAVIADDLTGACDTGVQFARHKFSTIVRRQVESIRRYDAEIVVLNTNSRNASPTEASKNTEQACIVLARTARRLIYLKVDSMLRGNIAAQIDGALKTTNHSMAIVAPAFPQAGRRLIDGWLKVSAGMSAEAVHLPTHLLDQGIESTCHIDHACVRRGKAVVAERVRQASKDGIRVVLIDAMNEDDLSSIAEAWRGMETTPLAVGSGGLAHHIASVCSRQKCVTTESQALDTCRRYGSISGSVVLLIGSDHSTTLAQIDALVTSRNPREVRLEQDGVEQAESAFQDNQDVLVTIQWSARQLRENLTKLSKLIVKQLPKGILLSGGDTTEFVCDALGVEAIELQDEIQPGVPWGWIRGGSCDGLAVCTKSGGLGTRTALVSAVDFLSKLQPQ